MQRISNAIQEGAEAVLARQYKTISALSLVVAALIYVGYGFLRDSHADYRVHALAPDEQSVEVVPGAMTRVAAQGSKLVNISSGGKMKDTWVLG